MREPLSGRDVAVLALGTFRAVRLLTKDDLPPVKAMRDRFIGWVGKDSSLVTEEDGEWELCPWCISVHVAWVLVCLAIHKPPWRLTVRDWMLVASLSATAGLLSTADSAMGRVGS